MYKQIIAYLIVLLLTGCSVTGKLKKGETGYSGMDRKKIFNEKNLTSSSFFIQKADIEVVNIGEKKSFLASVKYNMPDTFLISIRSKSGIEAVRILLTNDTLLLNDRLNKTMYFGSSATLKRRYGFDNMLIYSIIGGFIEDLKNKRGEIDCADKELSFATYSEDLNVNYLIDCKEGKVKSAEVVSDNRKDKIMIYFSGLKEAGDFIFTKQMEIRNLRDFESIVIKIDKVVVPYEGRIEFVPGRNFEQVELK